MLTLHGFRNQILNHKDMTYRRGPVCQLELIKWIININNATCSSHLGNWDQPDVISIDNIIQEMKSNRKEVYTQAHPQGVKQAKIHILTGFFKATSTSKQETTMEKISIHVPFPIY